MSRSAAEAGVQRRRGNGLSRSSRKAAAARANPSSAGEAEARPSHAADRRCARHPPGRAASGCGASPLPRGDRASTWRSGGRRTGRSARDPAARPGAVWTEKPVRHRSRTRRQRRGSTRVTARASRAGVALPVRITSWSGFHPSDGARRSTARPPMALRHRMSGDQAGEPRPDQQDDREPRRLHRHDERQVDVARRRDDRGRVDAAGTGGEIGGERAHIRLQGEQHGEVSAERDHRQDRQQDAGKGRPAYTRIGWVKPRPTPQPMTPQLTPRSQGGSAIVTIPPAWSATTDAPRSTPMPQAPASPPRSAASTPRATADAVARSHRHSCPLPTMWTLSRLIPSCSRSCDDDHHSRKAAFTARLRPERLKRRTSANAAVLGGRRRS
jgi:hypothetical protein